MATAVHQQMIDRNFSACRGCHDVERMYDPKKPLIGAIHKGMGPNAERRLTASPATRPLATTTAT